MSKPKLISFETCPFVQRSVIALQEKNIDYDIEYIDLMNKPEWFLKISPFGKVPVLQVDDTVLFESAVIAEYLNEVYPDPQLHPADPLTKAQNRAWIEYGSSLNMGLYKLSVAETEDDFAEAKQALVTSFSRLENTLSNAPYFNGNDYSLIDAAYAPVFQRVAILSEALDDELLAGLPKTQAYSEALLARPSTTSSVVPDFTEKFFEYLTKKNSVISQRLLTV